MTDTEDSATKKKLSLSGPGKLELKKTRKLNVVRPCPSGQLLYAKVNPVDALAN